MMGTTRVVKGALALGLAIATLSAATLPSQAQNGGAIAAGVIGGAALGALAAGAAGAAPPPPPPYYAPAYAPPPPRCWYEPQQVWNGYAYVVRRVRVCD